jgi:hypothetical protein
VPIDLEQTALIAVAKALGDSGETTHLFESAFGAELEQAVADTEAKSWAIELGGVEVEHVPDVLAKARTIFVSPLAPGLVFATNEDVGDSEFATCFVKREPASADASVAKAFAQVRLCKTAEERYVLGIVLEPDVVDSQKDFYGAEDVRKAAHAYMENAAQLGTQHSEIVTGKLKILETYLAPVDFEIGEEKVKKGSWVMGIRVVDDELWTSVKKGDYTGFSIGGKAYRKPEAAPVET